MIAQHMPQEELRSVVLDMLARRSTVLGLFTRSKANRFEAWVVTKPLTFEQERGLYRRAGNLRDRYPEIEFTLHVEHAGMYEDGNPFDAVPLDAERYQPE